MRRHAHPALARRGGNLVVAQIGHQRPAIDGRMTKAQDAGPGFACALDHHLVTLGAHAPRHLIGKRQHRWRYVLDSNVEQKFDSEDRIIVPSPKDVPTYDHKPEMSAPEVTRRVVEALPNYDLVILNFANPDMVGHTGVVEAGIKAVETVDACCARIISKLLELDGKALVTADHGNCEQMRNSDGSPNTAHTNYLVHFIYVAKDAAKFRCEDGILADVAPTLLFLLGLPQPKEMTGHNLLVPA